MSIASLDRRVTNWLGLHGVTLARLSLGVIFLWFGALKFIPGWSPAAELGAKTMQAVSFGLFSPAQALFILAAWETLIGLALLTARFMRVTLLLLGVQMIGTMLPLVLYPAETWLIVPLAPTLEGQYIIKNLVLLSAAAVVGATVRGRGLAPDPAVANH